MLKYNIIYLLLFYCLLTIIGCDYKSENTVGNIQQVAHSYKDKNVILVVIDGPRWDHTFGDSNRTYIPFLNELSKEGTLYADFFNNGSTYTNPGHCAISTGHYQEMDNKGIQIPKEPSFMHKFLKIRKDSLKAWLITSKDKLEVLKFCKDTSYNINPSSDCGINGRGSGYRDDTITFNRAIDVMKKYKPNVLFINFREPDYSAHFSDFSGYYKGLRCSDSLVNSLWEYVKSDDFYRGKTTLIITNDHGRHMDNVKDGLRSHGDNCSGCRRIFMLGVGLDFKKNTIIDDSSDLSLIHNLICTNLKLNEF